MRDTVYIFFEEFIKDTVPTGRVLLAFVRSPTTSMAPAAPAVGNAHFL
jgi:hypothetical protein